MSGAFLRYRVMAWVTGVVLATAFVWLVVGRLFLDYGNPDARPAFYGVPVDRPRLAVLPVPDHRRRPGLPGALRSRQRRSLILIAGTIPFASFFAEAAVHKDLLRRGLLPEPAPPQRPRTA